MKSRDSVRRSTVSNAALQQVQAEGYLNLSTEGTNGKEWLRGTVGAMNPKRYTPGGQQQDLHNPGHF